jgi:hypothetical protein
MRARAGAHLTIRAAEPSAMAPQGTCPPRPTTQKTGPVQISAVASRVWTASTGRRRQPRRMGHLGPLPFQSLAGPDRHPQPIRRLGQVRDLKGELGAAPAFGCRHMADFSLRLDHWP